MTPPPPSPTPLSLPGLPAELQARVQALGLDFARRFDAQFASPPAETHFCLKASRFARRVLAELCWPGPAFTPANRELDGRITLAATELVKDPELQPWMRVLPPGVAADLVHGEFVFADGDSLVRFLAVLEDRMRSRAPRRAAPAAVTPLEIPDRLPQLEPLWAADARIRPLLDFKAVLARLPLPPGVTPILFGSLAGPPPWPAYADADLALYLGSEALWSSPALLAFIEQFRQATAALLAVDPLQHHGPYVILEADLSHYAASSFPPQTLARATTLTGEPLALPIAPLAEDRILALEALAGCWRGVHHLAGLGWRALADRYTAKYLSSLVLLAPALYCASGGRPVEKSESFEIFKAELDSESVATIEAFERLRRDWRWTLHPPRGLLIQAGSRAGWLARTLNRWPAPELAGRLRALTPRLAPLFTAIFTRLAETAQGAES